MRLLIVSATQGQPERAPLTLYDLLGAHPEDDAEGLRNAFRKAAKANHPDLHPENPDAPVRFSGIVRAYAILRDAQERASYDRALGFEREELRPRPRRSFFDTMHNIVSEAAVIAVLAVVLGGGYVLLADAFRASVEAVKVADVRGRDSAKVATVQPAKPTGMTGREQSRDEGAEVPSIATAPSVASTVNSGRAPRIANDGPVTSSAERDVEVAKAIDPAGAKTATDELENSGRVAGIANDGPVAGSAERNVEVAKAIDPVGAKTIADELKNDELKNSDHAPGVAGDRPVASSPERDAKGAKVISATDAPTARADAKTTTEQLDRNQKMAPSAGVEFSSLEKDKSGPKSSSSDFAISEQKLHMKTPDMTTHGKGRAVAIRQTASHAPLKQASLENRGTSACSEVQSCPGRVPPLLGVGF
jgi:curved DNA-binding protein CbpA